MRSIADQFLGLKKLADLIGKSECNCLIKQDEGDVVHLKAIQTPNASEIVYAVDGYDVWSNGHLTKGINLSLEDAAKVVVAEYHLAKAARIKALHPDWNVADIMRRLVEGYQK